MRKRKYCYKIIVQPVGLRCQPYVLDECLLSKKNFFLDKKEAEAEIYQLKKHPIWGNNKYKIIKEEIKK